MSSADVSGGASSAPKSNLYTRAGDAGTSVLFTGDRLAKSAPVFQSLGSIDELNAAVGLAREHCDIAGNGLGQQLFAIQCCLIEIGSHVSSPTAPGGEKPAGCVFDVDGAKTRALEAVIDKIDSGLPPLTNFILPSGGLASCHLHVARTITRRTERTIVALQEVGIDVTSVLQYVNRLSDFFFCAARHAAMWEGREEAKFSAKRGVPEWTRTAKASTASSLAMLAAGSMGAGLLVALLVRNQASQ
eukprot:m.41843 g.41843  ORF g.41843 m.41843 type:complete len:245 (+) comp11494_c0_seq3:196-930(+)